MSLDERRLRGLGARQHLRRLVPGINVGYIENSPHETYDNRVFSNTNHRYHKKTQIDFGDDIHNIRCLVPGLRAGALLRGAPARGRLLWVALLV